VASSGPKVEVGRLSGAHPTDALRTPGVTSRPARIIVVEDERIVALDLKTRLTRMGHSVVAVLATGEDAIAETERLKPDFLLMDVQLQGAMDGIQAAEVIRKTSDVPLVYLTAFSDDRTVLRAKHTEPYGYVLKPFQERELHIVLEIALHRYDMMRKLREADAWRAALLQSVGDGVVATGPDGRVRFMNVIAQELTGWTEAEAGGKEVEQVLVVRDIPEQRSAPWRTDSNKRLLARNGAVRAIECETTKIVDAFGAILGAVWIFRDISERRRLHDRQRFMAFVASELASSLDERTLLNTLTSLVARNVSDWCAVHLTSRVVIPAANLRESSASISESGLWSAQGEDGPLEPAAIACRSSAVDLARLVEAQRPLDEDSPVASAVQLHRTVFEVDVSRDWFSAVLGVDETTLEELHVQAQNIAIFPLIARGRSLGALTVGSHAREREIFATDLPFFEQLARILATAIDNARLYESSRRATRLREDVLAIVSHDLRNPLSAITMQADLALRAVEAPSQEQARNEARLIRRNAARMSRLVNDLLDMARINSGPLSIVPGHHPVRELLIESIAASALSATEREVRIEVQGDVPEVLASCDRDRVLQVLSNLIGNAVKFSDSGKVVLLRARRVDSMVEFEIEDEAGGIAADQLDKIFDQYWRAPHTKRRGTGLGLFIAIGIVEAHGGRIWVESALGAGSTFRFTIPCAASVL
jgi:PAS domain S-box-containing protein